MADDSFCHCGTHRQAVEIAEKLFKDMVASDCPVWAFQIGAALRTIAIDALKNEGMTLKEVQTMGDVLTRSTREVMTDPAALLAAGIKRREELGT
ncbi:MAG: hypothetical protein DI533_20135 [Cereibacter sphaeroides]|uniref:Uncharacterized protein n=1 Tax=Cereibacter sphaeroides TaxID=1063 RepID=A0A2W5S218_CERSP|nr:MAG: hypothetical protein DI533_20135 [Cereibacter sphaeroides]